MRDKKLNMTSIKLQAYY